MNDDLGVMFHRINRLREDRQAAWDCWLTMGDTAAKAAFLVANDRAAKALGTTAHELMKPPPAPADAATFTRWYGGQEPQETYHSDDRGRLTLQDDGEPHTASRQGCAWLLLSILAAVGLAAYLMFRG